MPKYRLFTTAAELPHDDLDAADMLAKARPIYRQFQIDIGEIFGAANCRDESRTVVVRGPKAAAEKPAPHAPDPADAPGAADALTAEISREIDAPPAAEPPANRSDSGDAKSDVVPESHSDAPLQADPVAEQTAVTTPAPEAHHPRGRRAAA